MSDDKDEEEPKTVRVEHVFKREGPDGETEEFTPPQAGESSTETLEEENLRLKSQLGALALAEWKKEKDKLLSQIPVEKHAQVEELLEKDPKAIDLIKIQFGIGDENIDDGTEPVPPKGKAKAYRPPKKETVEELYKVLSSNDSTREQKKTAEAKLNVLWKKAIQNRKVARKSLRGDGEEW